MEMMGVVVDMMDSELNVFWFSVAAINVVMTIVTIVYAQLKLKKLYK